MTNSVEKIQQAALDDVTRWQDPAFGNRVDTPGVPTGRDYATSKVGGYEEVDPRFAPLDDRGSRKSLRSAVEELARDPQIRERVARETGNEGELEQIADEQAEAEANRFIASHPGYYRCDDNWQIVARAMAYTYLGWQHPEEYSADECFEALKNRGLFTAENISSVYRELSVSGSLEVAPHQAKTLSPSEQLAVISLCKAGQRDSAIGKYLSFMYPGADSIWMDGDEFLSDPRTLAARNSAVDFVFFHSRPNVTDSPEWQEFKRQYFRGKLAVSLADMDACHQAFERSQRDALRRSVISQATEPPAPENIDSLSDDQVDRLYHSTLREYAKTSRGPGILA